MCTLHVCMCVSVPWNTENVSLYDIKYIISLCMMTAAAAPAKTKATIMPYLYRTCNCIVYIYLRKYCSTLYYIWYSVGWLVWGELMVCSGFGWRGFHNSLAHIRILCFSASSNKDDRRCLLCKRHFRTNLIFCFL